MGEFFEEVIRFLTKLFPVIVILSMMGLGNTRKKKEQPGKRGAFPDSAPRPARPSIDPLDEDTRAPDVFAQTEALPASPSLSPPPPPRPTPAPQTTSASPWALPNPTAPGGGPRVDPRMAYAATEEQTEHAYDVDTDAYSGDTGDTVIPSVSEQISRSPSAAQLMQEERWDIDSLRRGVLLREILGPPIALRDEPGRFW